MGNVISISAIIGTRRDKNFSAIRPPGVMRLIRISDSVCFSLSAEIAEHAKEIYLTAGRTHAMPPGNVTQITPEERALLVAWYEGKGT